MADGGRADSEAESEAEDLKEVRRRRAELLESITALEQALAAPSRQIRWGERVSVALLELSGDLRDHVDLTEGSTGLYSRVIRFSPRLHHAVERLTQEHVTLTGLIEELIALVDEAGVTSVTAKGTDASFHVDPFLEQKMDSADTVRELGTSLLVALARHRQRGADLVYEAYSVDIGGQD